MMPKGSRPPPRRRASSPGFVYAALSVAFVVVIGALALSVNQAPPPTVAEFAPQAVEQITDAPDEQSSEFGSGGGGRGENLATPSPGPGSRGGADRPTLDVPRIKRCVGEPPRQIEDPQSPPCVPYWDGDNGGATAEGVTRDEIRVAYPDGGLENRRAIEDLVTFVNKRFVFYGRKIVLKGFKASGGFYAQPDPPAMQADAAHVKESMGGIFASLNYPARYGAESYYYDALADKKILSVAHRAGAGTTEEHYRRKAPYEWSVPPAPDTMLANVGEFVCKILAGRAPVYAGAESIGAAKRRFGIVYDRTSDGAGSDMSPLRSAMERCGAKPVLELQNAPSSDPTHNGQNLMLQMRSAEVTSVICWCDGAEVRGPLMQGATSQGYQPEWIVSTYIDNDVENSFRQAPPEQAAHVIGVSFRNRIVGRADKPWFWALKEVDPNYDPPEGDYYHLDSRYLSLLLLASGIQMAGPTLTPATFQQGLHRTRFPNPGAGAPPHYQAEVGFEGGRHAMFKDGAMYWYDAAQRGRAEPSAVGTVCYVDRGTRFGLGRWPSADPAFKQGPCV